MIEPTPSRHQTTMEKSSTTSPASPAPSNVGASSNHGPRILSEPKIRDIRNKSVARLQQAIATRSKSDLAGALGFARSIESAVLTELADVIRNAERYRAIAKLYGDVIVTRVVNRPDAPPHLHGQVIDAFADRAIEGLAEIEKQQMQVPASDAKFATHGLSLPMTDFNLSHWEIGGAEPV